MNYNKAELSKLIEKVRVSMEELIWILDKIDFECGENGCTARAEVPVKYLHDELITLDDLKQKISDIVEAGINQ